MTNPLVSIIVPVYNAQNSVARCLESICSQTYQELEIIVLNDGSTDDSLTICNQFCAKDPRVTVVDKENEGLSITRNVGMRLAQGKYLQFVDSDDHLAPDFTQRMVTAAEQHDATLVISPYWMEIPRDIQKEQLREKVKASNPENIAKKKLRRKKPEVEYREYGFLPAGVYDQKSYALHLMEKPVTFFYNVVWNKLYRRDVLNAHGLEFTNEMIHAEDQQFNIRYLEFVERVVSLEARFQAERAHRVDEVLADASADPLTPDPVGRVDQPPPHLADHVATRPARRHGVSAAATAWIAASNSRASAMQATTPVSSSVA